MNSIKNPKFILVTFSVLIVTGFVFAAFRTTRGSAIQDPLQEIIENEFQSETNTIDEGTIPENISISSLEYGPTATIIPRSNELPTTITSEEYLINTSEYAIIHYEESNSYSIVLLQEPLTTYQKQAEEELLKILNIPPSVACTRDIEIKVPRFVTDNVAEYRSLSFCN